MKTIIVTPASGLVVTVALAKQHLRLPTDSSDEDALLEQLIETATEREEHQLCRSVLTKTYRAYADDVSCLKLIPTLQSVSTVVLVDDEGEETELTETDYSVRDSSLIPSVVLKVAAQKTMIVTFTAGYGGSADVPKSIKQWILVDLATLYENREAVLAGSVASIPYPFVDGLLDPFRVSY